MADIVVVDSCVFICVLTGTNARDVEDSLYRSEQLLNSGLRSELDIYISALTIAEVLANGKIRNPGNKLLRRERISAARNWLESSPLKVVEADRSLAKLGGYLGQKHQLSGADALILASAVRYKAQRLFTWDRGLLKIGSKIDDLSIEEPSGSFQDSIIPIG